MSIFNKLKSAFGAEPNYDEQMAKLSDEHYKACVDHVNALRILGGANIPDSQIDLNIVQLSRLPIELLENWNQGYCIGMLKYSNGQSIQDTTIENELQVGDIATVHFTPNPTCVEEISNAFGVVTAVTDTEYTIQLVAGRDGDRAGELATQEPRTFDRNVGRITNSTYWATEIYPNLPDMAPPLVPSFRVNGQKVRVNPEDPRSVRVG